MTQDAVVTRILDKGMAEVVVTRGTACGGNCGNCESCMFQTEIKTSAINRISALPGQKVVIETKSSKIYGAIFLVYILPFIFFFIGYAIATALALNEKGCILVSFAFFLLATLLVVLNERKRRRGNEITYEIVQIRD